MSTAEPTPRVTFDALVSAIQGCEVIDLTVTLAEHLPAHWPTHMPFQRKVYNWYASRDDQIQPIHGFRGPYQTAWLTLDEHCGTHFDAPLHFTPPPDSGLPYANEFGLMSGDQVTPNQLMGPAAVIDATELTGQGGGGVSPEITTEFVTRWEREHGELQAGEVVLFRTDWDQFYKPMPEGSAYALDPFVRQQGPGWPTTGIPTLELLLDRGVKVVGLDGTSIGPSHDGAPAHQYGLSRGMLYLELLANLKRLPPRGAFFIFLPLKIERSSAGPGRAIALVPR